MALRRAFLFLQEALGTIKYGHVPHKPFTRTRVSNRILAQYCHSADIKCNASPSDRISLQMLELGPNGKNVTVTWGDGKQSKFHSVWLRHNCHCSQCRQEHSGQKLTDPASIPHRICIEEVHLSGNQLEIKWNGNGISHTGNISLSYLHANCYSFDSLKIRREAVKLDSPVKALPEILYGDFKTSSQGVYRWLKEVNQSGICLLKGVPPEDNMVQKVAEHIGPVCNTIYGKTFDVVSMQKPINVAYSSVGLDYHMDLVYYESPPGIQFLHCLKFDDCVEGGESRFQDLFYTTEQFRLSNPGHFQVLSKVPATFQKIHYSRDFPVEMRYQRPVIILNQYNEVVAVNWAPAFEGPLAVDEEDVEIFYAAYEAFAKAIKNSSNILEYRLHPGDLIAFNNRRTLHARNVFELNGGVRHLKGCYVNIDHFKSQVQVLSRLHGNDQPPKRVGNQDWF